MNVTWKFQTKIKTTACKRNEPVAAEVEDHCLLGCCTVHCGTYLRTFQTSLLQPLPPFPTLSAESTSQLSRRSLSAGMLHRALWYRFTDVSDELTAAITTISYSQCSIILSTQSMVRISEPVGYKLNNLWTSHHRYGHKFTKKHISLIWRIRNYGGK
jgi:hypothetical protein